MRIRTRLGRRLRQWLFSRGYQLTRLTEQDLRYLQTIHQTVGRMPAGAEADLRPDHPELLDLRRRYAALGMNRGGRWSSAAVERHVDLHNFRGDTLYLWHYREAEQVTRLKYYAYLRYVMQGDTAGLLPRLGEDGAFGCWTFAFPDLPTVSRDLLDSVNEIGFLQRKLGVLDRPGLRVLDIGAGYGRLAHRFTRASPLIADYCCVDGVPESTFLSRYYLAFRAASPPARVVPLDRVESELAPGSFDLAVNIHSFPECAWEAIAWWVGQLKRLRVPDLLVVPNDGERLFTLESDGTRRPFEQLLDDAGYRKVHAEPVIADPAVRELTGIQDAFVLFRLESDAG